MRHAASEPGGSLAALELGAAGEPVAPPVRLWPRGGRGAEAPGTSPWRGDPDCSQPPEAAAFAPHGLAVGAPLADGGVPVAVIGHGAREAVELFVLHGAGSAAVLRWSGCVALPPDATGNDAWIGADRSLWVTRYQPAAGGARGLFFTVVGGLGLPTGEVLHREGGAWRAVPGTRGANPNGVLLAPDERTLAVAFTGARAVALVALEPGGAPPRTVALAGHPDNLLWSARDTVLAPVHASGLRTLLCRLGARPCRAPWTLQEIDPASGAARLVFSHDGSRLGAVASVAEVEGRLYLGAVFDDRIGVLVRGDRQ
jgi:hypothetical protein